MCAANGDRAGLGASSATGSVRSAASRPSLGDTDMFLAVLSGAGSAPAPAPAAAPSAGAGAPAATDAAAAPAPAGAKNPLVAAMSQTGQFPGSGISSGDALYPINAVEGGEPVNTFNVEFSEKKSKKGIVIGIIVALLAVAAIAGVFFGLRMREAGEARAQIRTAITTLAQSDAAIVALDEALASGLVRNIPSGNLADIMAQSTIISNAITQAEEAINQAERSSGVLEDADLNAITKTRQSIAARRSFIEIGRMLSQSDATVSTAASSLDSAWRNIADARSLIAQEAEQRGYYYNNLWAGTDMSWFDLGVLLQCISDAQANVASARGWVDAARVADPEADLSLVTACLDALDNQLYILGQMDYYIANYEDETASGYADTYIALEAAANDAFAQLPAAPEELLRSSAAASNQGLADSFMVAHEKCIAADKVLGTYLGNGATIGLASLAQGTAPQPAAQTQPAGQQTAENQSQTVNQPAGSTTQQPADAQPAAA